MSWFTEEDYNRMFQCGRPLLRQARLLLYILILIRLMDGMKYILCSTAYIPLVRPFSSENCHSCPFSAIFFVLLLFFNI